MIGGDVELRTLRVFLALAEELHFARTAERVGLTPSRVSQIVRELERHVGGPLFVRTSPTAALSPLGEQLRDTLGPAVAGVDDALGTARRRAAGPSGTVRVGSYIIANFGPRFFDVVKVLAATHPGIRVRIVDVGLRHNPLDRLRAGDVDALAMRLPIDDPDVVIGPRLSREPRVLLVARDHRLASRTSVVYEDLADETVGDSPTLPRRLLDSFVPPRTPSGRLLRRSANDSFLDTVALVAAGEMVHPTVPSAFDQVARLDIVSIPITDLPDSETALVWRAGDTDRPGLRALADALAIRP